MKAPFDIVKHGWKQLQPVQNRSFVCGYCSKLISSDRGYGLHIHRDTSGKQVGGVYICPNCNGTTLLTPDDQKFPGHTMGNPVKHLPDDLDTLYEEARRCSSHKCYTATVMLCRKILMNLAVDRGAASDLNFIQYVNYLSDNGYIPPNGKHWVDHIRKKGNEANHEIKCMEEKDAQDLLVFIEMLLKFIHEFPKMISVSEGP